ncbi:hypothetical protein PAXINDRAFT_75657, partial [Paxillus involutus ATCC 200175]
VWGWLSTLVGVAIGPVFVAVMGVQAGLVAKCEVRNKRAREEVARVYYEHARHALEPVRQSHFDEAPSLYLSIGIRGAFVEGCTYGVASALIYLAEALLFYVGATLIARGTYTYLQMVQVLNLVVFTVTIGSQLMAFTQKIGKTIQATIDLFELVNLRTDGTNEVPQPVLTDISSGNSCTSLTLQQFPISFASEPKVRIMSSEIHLSLVCSTQLTSVSPHLYQRSTCDILLILLHQSLCQELYVWVSRLCALQLSHLTVIISKEETLVRGLADNIDVLAKMVASEERYPVGEHAALISGGQGQRLQITRALARPSRILTLDECTSALDGANQSAVMEMIKGAKVGGTAAMIIHRVPAMKMWMCDGGRDV